MIIEKDNLSFYTDKKGNPDVLLYAPQNYLVIRNYIIENQIKKLALCGGGLPTQEYLNTIIDFKWVEHINGYIKGLDFSFLNRMQKLKTYIGIIDFEIYNNSVEELYIGTTTKTKISKYCANLKILDIEGCKSIKKIFENGYPPLLRQMTFLKGKFESCTEFMINDSIEELSFINCSKLKSLEQLRNFKGLKKLRLENCRSLFDISEISQISSLKELLIIKCPNVDIHNQSYSNKLLFSVY